MEENNSWALGSSAPTHHWIVTMKHVMWSPLFIGLHWLYFSFMHHRVIWIPFETSFTLTDSVFYPVFLWDPRLMLLLKFILICVPSREFPILCLGMFMSPLLHSYYTVNLFDHHPSSRKGAPLVFQILCPSAMVHNIIALHILNSFPLLD